MNANRKSDESVVPATPANNGAAGTTRDSHLLIPVGVTAASHARLEKVTLPGGREIYYNYESQYESLAKFASLNRVANIAANASPDNANTYAAYKYLGASMVVEADHPAVPTGLRLTYGGSARYPGLDRFGRVVWQTWRRTNWSAVDRYFYGYDRSGNRKWRAERSNATSAAGQRDEAYVYDGLDRLIGAKRGILPDKPYQAPHPGDATKDGAVDPADSGLVTDNWDPAGQNQNTWTMGDFNGDGVIDGIDLVAVNTNWAPAGVTESVTRSWSWGLTSTGNWSTSTTDGVEQTRTHNNANEITAITRSPGDLPDPLYGPAGCNVFGPKPNDDANGMHQRYDAWNRLATVHWDDGDDANQLDANDTLRATYRYDGLNRRVRKIVVGDDANHTTEHAYHNTAWQVLEIRRGTDGNTPTATAYKQYAWDLRYIDAPICRWWDADTDGQMEPTAGEQHYYTNDAQFNATALIDANSGSVVERYIYDPYGKPMFLDANWTPITASAYENEILYCGYRWDPESYLYHVRHRYYHPTLGRWVTRDRLGYVDGLNVYEYVRSGPIGYTDPMGQAVGVPVGKGPKYANGGSYVYSGVMLKATDDETTKIVDGGGGYIISTLDVKWVIKDCNKEGDSGVIEDKASKTWTSQVNVANGAIDVDRETYYNRNVTVRSGGAHGYHILDEKAKAGDQKTALEYTVLLNYDLTEKNGYSKLTCTKGYIMASWDYTVYVGGNADYQNAMKTVKPYEVRTHIDNPTILLMPWAYDGIEYTDYCHKPTCHTVKVATPHQGAVQVTKGSVTVRYSWDRCTANTKLFAEMTGIELATGTVIRPGRRPEVNKGTPMTLNVNQGNLARWQDELGG